MKKWVYTLLVFFTIAVINRPVLMGQTVAPRIANSPYPVSSVPDTLFLVNINGLTNSQQLTVATLQGLLAKTKPRIMVQRGSAVFQADLVHYGVTYDSTYLNDFTGLMAHFKPSISGYIFCIINDTSANNAISICNFFSAVAATVSDTAQLDSLGITELYNVVGQSQMWALDTFRNSYCNSVLTLQDPAKCTYLSDYSVFAGAFHFWVPTVEPLADSALVNTRPNSALLGWGPDEFYTVAMASAFGKQVNASDWAPNLSTFSNCIAPTQQKNHSADTTIIPNTHTVCFVMTDGDNVQWLINDFADNTSFYGSPHRGEVNLGWTVSPSLAELGPTMMKYMYDSAASSPNGSDYFIAAPSGMGYYYPDFYPNLDSASAISGRMMQKAGLSILNIIGDNYNVADMVPYLDNPAIDAVFYYTYDDAYYGLNGHTDCINNKPVIGCRYDLWSQFFTTDSLAQIINSLPKDPNSPEGYSLIPVHVWTDGVDSVIRCAHLLDSNVRVVTPDAFVKLFMSGAACNSASSLHGVSIEGLMMQIEPNPCSTKTNVVYTLPGNDLIELNLYDAFGKKLQAVAKEMETTGPHQVTINTAQLSPGIYMLSLAGSNFSKAEKLVVVR